MYFNRSQKAGRRRVRRSVKRGGRKVGSVKHRRGGSRSFNNLKKKSNPYVNNSKKIRYAGSLKLFPEWENTLYAAKRAGISKKNNSYKSKNSSRYNYGKLGYKFNNKNTKKKNVAKLNYRLN